MLSEFKKQISRTDIETGIRFQSTVAIQSVKSSKKFKINIRSALGVVDPTLWIFSLNIGNVMNLSPMNHEELGQIKDVQSNEIELSKDTLLEKFILYMVSHFCVGTELRFIAQKQDQPQRIMESERWHAKALEVGIKFMPDGCPLVEHI